MNRIAFFGLGAMGGPMAANLLRAGHALTVFDIDPNKLGAARSAGAAIAPSVGAAVRDAEMVISLVPSGNGQEGLFFGGDGILASASPGTMIVDCATSGVDFAQRLAADAGARRLASLDAPMSGGVTGAAAGTLTFMVGGEAETLEAARAVLLAMGKIVVHAGKAGMGQAAKLCNNMIVGAITVATCEGFALAERMGLDTKVLFDISSKASAQSWVLDNLCPIPGLVAHAPSSHGYRPGGASKLLLKDLRLAQEAALAAGMSTPTAALALQLYTIFCAAGCGDVDSSGIIGLIKGDLSGLPRSGHAQGE